MWRSIRRQVKKWKFRREETVFWNAGLEVSREKNGRLNHWSMFRAKSRCALIDTEKLLVVYLSNHF